MTTTQEPPQNIQAHGKFFSCRGQKFFFKAMRLPDVSATLDFGQKLKVRKRLDDLKAAHTTGLVLTESQAQPLLDLAAQSGLSAMLELSIAPEELLRARGWKSIVSRIAHTAHVFSQHPALIGYILDCPVRQDQLRAGGLANARARLRSIIRIIKDRAPAAIAGIKLRPETRALTVLEEDFLYGEIPALEPIEIRDFVVALHNLAEARPVIIEFADASPGQDEAVAVAFGTGAAGVVAPPVPAPVSKDWLGVKLMRASDLMPFVTLNGTCPPPAARMPMVSVVICAYNAERTMRRCLESLRKLDYPNYEVVIVDDGSRDSTAEISMDFPEFRLIRQSNKGLSVARNVGLHAARGELIAYTDSDCVVDPHWLTLMMRSMVENDFDGCGGPNYAPHEDGWIEACCAASPGAPCHVLVGQDRAEHLAGCNMVFSKAALLKIGAFDPQYTAAGDDVDICWRLIDAGYKLGFCPAAFVWHFRRNTIKAYYGQQRGYGRAEAMLYPRYPERFNVMRQIAWRGTIPGIARTLPGGNRQRVMWNTAAGSQALFDPSLTLAGVIPQTLEYTVFAAIALVISIILGWSVIPAAAMLALGPIWALYYGWHAPLEKSHESFRARLLIAYLAYTGPMIRTITRYKTRAKASTGLGAAETIRQKPSIDWARRSVNLAYWNEQYVTRDTLLDRVVKLFARTGHPAIVDAGWNDFDLEVHPSPWTRIELKTADEEHGGMKLKNIVVARIRTTRLTELALAAGALSAAIAALAGLPEIALGLGALTIAGAICVGGAMIEAGRIAYRAIEECATELNLSPLGKPVRERSRVAVEAAANNPVAVRIDAQER
ncbi:MAG: glycosyltransferase [Candidatus Binatus sp.]|uniref:glycosyltransferase n=1 Tax=Candidatus Binatus sp. TaxID=2811406 RepID=UPI002717BE1D|nr:glycosyltransferase [Candidatus Binatus sp.]MDO8433958.1 glycosyltransferase [Candidatus Binatus sp.]